MINLFKNYGFNINESQAEKFEKYCDLLLFYNEKFNITAITEKEEIYKKHFIDSLYGLEYIEKGALIDIGSGGGFPALPLKILKKNLCITMLEATGKKCEFLKTVIKELDLKDTFVINDRAETTAKDSKYREKFDFVTARAVANMNTLSEYCLPFVKVGGKMIAYKGDGEEEGLQAENAVKILGGKIKEIKKYELDGARRTLIIIDKLYPTDKKYPRGNGKERKNPLK